MIKQNLAKYGIEDLQVNVGVTVHKRVPVIRYYDSNGYPVNVGLGDAQTHPFPEGACLEEVSLDAGIRTQTFLTNIFLSEFLATGETFRNNPWVTLQAQEGYHLRGILDIRDAQGALIGQIQDGVFIYTRAPSLRDFIGWVWCSGLGKTKELSSDLNSATALVTRHTFQSNGQGDLNDWEFCLGQVYMQGVTVRYGCQPYINSTRQFAIRNLLGLDVIGFSFGW